MSRQGSKNSLVKTKWRETLRREPCSYCGRTEAEILADIPPDAWTRLSNRPITCEHIQPVSDGGVNAWWNLAPACWHCNISRASTPFLIFLIESRRLLVFPEELRRRQRTAFHRRLSRHDRKRRQIRELRTPIWQLSGGADPPAG